MKLPREIQRFAAFGSGAGISIEGPRGSESLRICAVRVRPTGIRVLSTMHAGSSAALRRASPGRRSRFDFLMSISPARIPEYSSDNKTSAGTGTFAGSP